ncbi:MaoC family dehydratase [Leucobacter allii]|uniref:MaoC family dehydratase n=1 Tax=Leucobacter allii TaxID=2932247 RepID=A0ABY4FJS7_9MICO|nr:MaoC/PaaZ C-terminal domain-containing protein [Leucobacter allii]UOQ56446.1 MaoC family dehydratase [Leucobacter allii]
MAELLEMTGAALEPSEPFAVVQEDVDRFAAISGDAQWIHVDPARAVTGPFGGTIVHGYLLLSLLGGYWTRTLRVADAAEGLNYGLDRVRFIAPVRVGAVLEIRGVIVRAKELEAPRRGIRLHADLEIRDCAADHPCVVARTIVQYAR